MASTSCMYDAACRAVPKGPVAETARGSAPAARMGPTMDPHLRAADCSADENTPPGRLGSAPAARSVLAALRNR